jgi:hypothetical protein
MKIFSLRKGWVKGKGMIRVWERGVTALKEISLLQQDSILKEISSLHLFSHVSKWSVLGTTLHLASFVPAVREGQEGHIAYIVNKG